VNALFGLWQTDGAPVDPAQFSAMAASLDFWGADPPAFWHGDSLALGCQPGHTDKHTDAQPIHDPASGLTLVASARLIHRGELAGELSIPGGELSALSDGHLLLAAWQRWGRDCVHHLNGDWHFALWDASARRLFLARDQHGTSSLYYHRRNGLFAFASTQKPLLALPGLPHQPNLVRIAQILSGVMGDGSQTGYTPINRLPPAHRLVLDPSGLGVERYWYPEKNPEVHLAGDDAYVEAFVQHYRAAVESRLSMAGETGLMLSGGLDSGSLAALAAPALAERGKALHAFTSVPVGQTAADLAGGGPLDEGPLAQAVAEAVGNIHLTRVGAADISPLAGVERMLWVHDEPTYPAGNSYWLAAIQTAARSAGVTTLLSGTAGNDTVSWRGAPPDLTGLLWRKGPGSAVDALRRMHTRTGLSPVALLWAGAAKPLLRRVRGHLTGLLPSRQSDWDTYNPLRPTFLQRSDIAPALHETVSVAQPAYADAAGWAAWRLDVPGRWQPPTFHLQDGGAFGLDLFDPTADRRLMEFCFAVPTAQYHNGAQDRWLIRRAMAGRLPDRVRLIQRRARQSADLVNRLHTHRDETNAAIARLSAHPLAGEVLDMPRLAAVAENIRANPVNVSHNTASIFLLRGLMTGIFLERFAQ
jgi:asparagine synthase (glutamine-hydrolysing)